MWLIVTQGNPIEKLKARWLTIFLENWYNAQEIKQLVVKHTKDLKGAKLNPDHLTLLTKALAQSRHTSFQERDLLIKSNLSINTLNENLKSSLPSISSKIKQQISDLINEKKFSEALVYAENIPNECDGEKDFLLGKIYQNSGEFKKSEKNYKAANKKGNIDSLNNLAVLYYDHEKYKLAKKYYLEAINNGDIYSLNNLANLYHDHKKYELAEKYYLEAIKIRDNNAHNNLAILYKDQKKYELAEKYYLESIKNGVIEALNNLAVLYHDQKKNELAEKYYLEAIKKGVSDALNNLANLNQDQKKYELAEKYYLEAIEKGHINSLNNLAILYHYLKKYELAEKYYLEAIEKGNIKALYNLTSYYYFSINKSKAIEFYKKIDVKDILEKKLNIVIQLWIGELDGIHKKVFELGREKDGIDNTFIKHLLIHYQNNLTWQLFNDPKIGEQLKNKFKPLFYATSILVDDEKSKLNHLKIPPEIKETVDDILKNIEDLQKQYYPE